MPSSDWSILPAVPQTPEARERPTFHVIPRRRAWRRHAPAGMHRPCVDPATWPPQHQRHGVSPVCVPPMPQQDMARLVRDALQARYPLVTTARALASRIAVPSGAVQPVLEGLARQGIIDTPRKGYYRWRPAPEGGPMHHMCEHRMEPSQDCPRCAALRSAEAILLEAQRPRPPEPEAQAFPRSPVELRILEALRQAAPRALTAHRLADTLGLPRQAVQSVLYVLALLNTVRMSEKGYFRSLPPTTEEPTT